MSNKYLHCIILVSLLATGMSAQERDTLSQNAGDMGDIISLPLNLLPENA